MKIFLTGIICFLFIGAAYGQAYYTLDDKTVSYDEIFSAPKTILFLWTSQCPYCVSEFVNLNNHPEFEKDVAFYYINLGDRKSMAQRLVFSLKLRDAITKKIILDPRNTFADQFDISGVPTFIFFKNGKLVDRSFYLDEKLLKEMFGNE
ncbi:MAG: TlpA disulfide reductase family protein [Candidatus Omnitrophota bacterium]